MGLSRRTQILVCAAAMAFGTATRADAAFISYTSESAFLAAAGGSLSLATFDALSNQTFQTLDSSISASIPAGVTFSSSAGGSTDLFVAPTNFGGNMAIDSPSLFANFFGTPLIATFSPTVTAVGANLLSYHTSATLTVTVRNADGSTSSFLVTPSNTLAAFFGVIATDGDSIDRITFAPPGGFTAGVDDFRFGQASVPEPSTLMLMTTAALWMGRKTARSRLRRRSALPLA